MVNLDNNIKTRLPSNGKDLKSLVVSISASKLPNFINMYNIWNLETTLNATTLELTFG